MFLGPSSNICQYFSTYDELHFFSLFSTDASYLILQVASLPAKNLKFYFQISYSKLRVFVIK